MAAGATASPCTGVCTLDATGAICLGCRRTIGEIAEWSTASERRRAAIVARIHSAQRIDRTGG